MRHWQSENTGMRINDNVPHEAEIMKMIVWIRNQCSQAGMAGESNRQKFFTRVQGYCDRINGRGYQGAVDRKPASR
jgi:hypothetical protein